MEKRDHYERLGVSSSKEDVHDAIKNIDKGIFPGAFCKILPDLVGGDDNFCNIMHADGAGTKSSLAYIYWKETNDLSVWKGVVQDSIVMNLDDLLCVGITDEKIILSSSIERNKNLILPEVVSTIINGTTEIIDWLKTNGVNITSSGGETADVGDLVRTITLNNTVFVRARRDKIIVPDIRIGDSVIGLSSTGKATYENCFNSGIGSNGLTSARHDIFNRKVRRIYPESYDSEIEDGLAYNGKHFLTDESYLKGIDYGKLVLSPTRTYAPIIMMVLKQIPKKYIHAIIHCSGGGQTKVLNFLNEEVEVVKNKLFPIPQLFKEIQESSGTELREMYKNFNMGHRMEIYCSPEVEQPIIGIARKFNIEAQKIGFCVKRAEKHRLSIRSRYRLIKY